MGNTTLTPAFNDALQYTADLHAGQLRKGPDGIPYIAHLIGVASIVLEHGGSETQAIAALLHDAIEDQPRDGRTEREIAEQFGMAVLDIVLACTDSLPGSTDRSVATWRGRKEHYLKHLPDVTEEARLVSLADKLYNARAILKDLRHIGDKVWDRFKVTKDESLWYYKSLVDVFLAIDTLPPQQRLLAMELERAVGEMVDDGERKEETVRDGKGR
jgi:(p)ppGpp synthase/HD superfamily hydrolase